MFELRTGLDLCGIHRMEEALGHPHFLDRCLTPEERAYLAGKGAGQAATLAGLWAAKEAVLKALGTGIALPMAEVEILHDEAGAPVCRLSGRAAELAGGGTVSVSITHEAGMAAAFCVLVRPGA